MVERDVEKYFREQVEKRLHGKAFKFVSPGNRGVPDRIVIAPGGRIYFIELKRPNEESRALQNFVGKKMRELGCNVRTINTKSKVDEFITEVLKIGV